MPIRERLFAAMALKCWVMGGASLLARPRCGERVEATALRSLLVGDMFLCWNLCCAIKEGWLEALEPRLWADCSLRSLCVRGEGGGRRSVVCAKAGTGASLDGLGMAGNLCWVGAGR